MKQCPICDTPYPDENTTCSTDGALLIRIREWAAGSIVRNKYRILGKIGQGGMGLVYKAEHMVLEEVRALKVMNPNLASDQKFVRRFRQEAQAARRLQHANIVHVDDCEQADDGSLFIAMDYIEGVTLRQLLRATNGPLPIARAFGIARGVADALAAADALGMVHRDIKPENILIARDRHGRDLPKVTDFGIAAMRESAVISSTRPLLTPAYASPEQWRGMKTNELDGRADLYALGITLYEMLAGTLPFHAHTDEGWMRAHLDEIPSPPSRHNPELAHVPSLDDLVLQLISKNREDRPKNGLNFIQELNLVEAQSTWQRPTTPARRSSEPVVPPPVIPPVIPRPVIVQPRPPAPSPAPVAPQVSPSAPPQATPAARSSAPSDSGQIPPEIPVPERATPVPRLAPTPDSVPFKQPPHRNPSPPAPIPRAALKLSTPVPSKPASNYWVMSLLFIGAGIILLVSAFLIFLPRSTSVHELPPSEPSSTDSGQSAEPTSGKTVESPAPAASDGSNPAKTAPMGRSPSGSKPNQQRDLKTLQDTQSKIAEIQKDVSAGRAATQDKAYKKWDQYVKGSTGPAGTAVPSAAASGWTGYVDCRSGFSYVDMYSAPASLTKTATIPCGESFQILGTQSGYYQVRTKRNASGYVAANLVSASQNGLGGPASAAVPDTATPGWIAYADCRSAVFSVGVYSAPASLTKIDDIPCGDRVQVLGREGEFYTVRTKRIAKGYVAANLVSSTQPSASTSLSKHTQGGPVRVGANVQAARIISRVQPTYPELARQTRVSGTVHLHVMIGKDGSVEQLEVIDGHPLLQQAALDAVRQWRYQPMLLNGEPIGVDTTIDVIFSLNQ